MPLETMTAGPTPPSSRAPVDPGAIQASAARRLLEQGRLQEAATLLSEVARTGLSSPALLHAEGALALANGDLALLALNPTSGGAVDVEVDVEEAPPCCSPVPWLVLLHTPSLGTCSTHRSFKNSSPLYPPHSTTLWGVVSGREGVPLEMAVALVVGALLGSMPSSR
jgi:hypothetical protein